MAVLLLVFKIFIIWKVVIYILYVFNCYINDRTSMYIGMKKLRRSYKIDPSKWKFDILKFYSWAVDDSMFRHLYYVDGYNRYVFWVSPVTYERLKFYSKQRKRMKVKDKEAEIFQKILGGD